MLVQFGNNWIQKIPLTAKLDSAYGLVQFWLSSEFFSSNYFQIGQHVVLLHIHIGLYMTDHKSCLKRCIQNEFQRDPTWIYPYVQKHIRGQAVNVSISHDNKP